jgi:hypothetical protein
MGKNTKPDTNNGGAGGGEKFMTAGPYCWISGPAIVERMGGAVGRY